MKPPLTYLLEKKLKHPLSVMFERMHFSLSYSAKKQIMAAVVEGLSSLCRVEYGFYCCHIISVVPGGAGLSVSFHTL